MTHPPPPRLSLLTCKMEMPVKPQVLGLLEGLGEMRPLERGGLSGIREEQVGACV